ncbi:MAG TPA: 3-oxoacyl-ACP reductase [Lachnospiraceae bacterium]|nr:3-oxoacyl-ACP reductase [Lachnospiraceae bacterium]
MTTSLHGKTAFITGASRGIGAGIARSLAAQGYSLGLSCQKSSDAIHDLADSLAEEYGISVSVYIFDVADHNAVSSAAEDFLREYGHIDVLINNAGISYVGLFTDLTYEEWNRIVNVNLSSSFYTAKAFLPSMVEKKSGDIINISSMWGNVGASCEVAYSATKGGVNAYTKALAKEVAPSGITVNAIACGVIDTDMNGHLDATEKAELMEEIPMGRFGTPEDVGQCVLGILSSPYLTGQIITLDGGYL